LKLITIRKPLLFRVIIIVLCHFVYLICGFSSAIFAQNLSTTLENSIVEKGFENVEVETFSDTIRVFYENRRYRFEPRGLAELIGIFKDGFDKDFNILDIYLQKNQVKMLRIVIPLNAYRNFLDGFVGQEAFYHEIFATLNVYAELANPVFVNKSNFKADIAVKPFIWIKFGNFKNPIESNINLIPELNATIAKGLTLKAQLIIPIQNDHFFVAERETVRPGNITLNQFANLEDNFYLNITAGFFNKNRAGVNFELNKLFSEGKFEIGANVGYTGYYSFTGIETEFYDKQKYLTAILNAQYRYNPYDIIARLTVGNFLYNTLAAKFEVLRQFGQVKIGFFAAATKDDYDGGFRFTIPLPPRKYTKMRIFRVRPADAFAWEYRAKGFPQNGVQYQTGYNLTDMLMDYNPDFVKKRLIIEINDLADK